MVIQAIVTVEVEQGRGKGGVAIDLGHRSFRDEILQILLAAVDEIFTHSFAALL